MHNHSAYPEPKYNAICPGTLHSAYNMYILYVYKCNTIVIVVIFFFLFQLDLIKLEKKGS